MFSNILHFIWSSLSHSSQTQTLWNISEAPFTHDRINLNATHFYAVLPKAAGFVSQTIHKRESPFCIIYLMYHYIIHIHCFGAYWNFNKRLPVKQVCSNNQKHYMDFMLIEKLNIKGVHGFLLWKSFHTVLTFNELFLKIYAHWKMFDLECVAVLNISLWLTAIKEGTHFDRVHLVPNIL